MRDEEQPLLKSIMTAEKGGPSPGKVAGELKAAKVSSGKVVKLAKKPSETEALSATVRALVWIPATDFNHVQVQVGV